MSYRRIGSSAAATTIPPQRRKFERTTAGLRDALFCELEDIRDGVSDPMQTAHYARVAEAIVVTVELDFRKEELELRKREADDRRRMIMLREREERRAITAQSHQEIIDADVVHDDDLQEFE